MATTIPQGSTVLVTGVNGYIGAHIADLVIQAGFKVRGVVRKLEKAEAVRAALEEKHGPGKFEVTVVENMVLDGAFDQAVKGVSAVAHVASNVSFSNDPNIVITPDIIGIQGILKSAAAEPSIKRFVYTSASSAASSPKPNHKFKIDSNSWNDEVVAIAWQPPPYDGRDWAVYFASKMQGEQAVWEFVDREKPHFTTVAVLPSMCLGASMAKGLRPSTGSWPISVWNGTLEDVAGVEPQWFIDVRDVSRLHVAAIVDPEVKNKERIFGFAEPFSIKDIFNVIRKLRPEHKLVDDPTNDDRDITEVVERPRAEELLQKNYGKGFTSLEDSIASTLKDL